MEPTDNDVLSGRGARYNQHPGNGHFRRMLEQQKDVYMTGTKKQKMNMSNAIVEAIYSMEPPGRFLKQCAESGQWKELSKRDAADKTAQAMAYAVSGKEKSKRRRERRRQSRQSLSLAQDDVVGAASSQPIDQSAQQPQLNSPKKKLEGNVAVASSSSAARHGLNASGSTAAGSTDNTESAENGGHTDSVADEMLHVPRNSNLQQQLMQQLQQSSRNNATLPTTLGNSIDQNVNQNGFTQLLLQTLQQQQLQQQLQLQYSCQNPFGLQTQTTPQPALDEGLTQLLYQAQQQQHNAQQRQIQQQQQLSLLRRLLNHQNVLPASLPTTLSSSAPSLASQGVLPSNAIIPSGNSLNYLLERQSQSANNNILQNLQQQSNPSNALLLGMLSNLQNQPNIGTFNAPHEAHQLDQLQRSLMLQQNQLLTESLTASNQPIRQQQQSLPLGQLHRSWQTALLPQIQNSQNPPPINVQPSDNTADLSDRQVDKEQSVSEEENRK
eukprot:scaffold2053_cov106-Skeletonema_dohrnii-CCMP3373.AAC.5